jgi:hypothetical protein
VNKPGALATDVESSRVEQCLPTEVQYVCLYWVQHLQKSGGQLRDNDQVHQFLQNLYFIGSKRWVRQKRYLKGILAIILLKSIALVGLPATYQKPLN